MLRENDVREVRGAACLRCSPRHGSDQRREAELPLYGNAENVVLDSRPMRRGHGCGRGTVTTIAAAPPTRPRHQAGKGSAMDGGSVSHGWLMNVRRRSDGNEPLPQRER